MVYSTWLTDDTLMEIFTHLPLNSIYKFKCLSKVWLSILSDSNFIIKWFQINKKSLPWILYIITGHDSDENPLKFSNAYHDSHSQFISRNDYGFSFQFLRNANQGAKLFPLGSSNGLVLCYSFSSDDQRRYHVCNPLTHKWVSLPPPPRSQATGTDVTGIFCEYPLACASCYKVVSILRFIMPLKKFNVIIFSSDSGVWESFQVSCDEIVVWGHLNFDKLVILNGVLFWIEGGHRMLVYNLNQNNGSDGHLCSSINLPDEEYDDYESAIFDSRIGKSEGRVCYVKTRITATEMIMSVWSFDEGNWQMLDMDISVDNILAELGLGDVLQQPKFWGSPTGEVAPIQVLGFSPVDRNVVFLWWKRRVWGFNLQRRSFEELCMGNRHVLDAGVKFLPFALNPMPTALTPPSW